MQLYDVTNHNQATIRFPTLRGSFVPVRAGQTRTIALAARNARRHLRWERSGLITIEEAAETPTPPVTPGPGGGQLDFSDPANSGHIPGI